MKLNQLRNKHIEYVGLLLIMAVAAVVAMIRFNIFQIPLSDFFAFQDIAQYFLKFRLPSEITRGPLYPALMGILSLLFKGKTSFLVAARVINIICAVSSIYLVFRITKKIGGRNSIISAALFAFFPATVLMTHQPLPEMCLIFFTLLAIYLSYYGYTWSLLVGAITALVRWDGIIIVMLLLLKKAFFDRKKSELKDSKNLLIKGLIVISPLLIWFLLPLFNKDLEFTRYSGHFKKFLTGQIDFQNFGNLVLMFKRSIIGYWDINYLNIKQIILSIAVISIIITGIIRSIFSDLRKVFIPLSFMMIYFYFLSIISSPSKLEIRNIYVMLWTGFVFFGVGIDYLIDKIPIQKKVVVTNIIRVIIVVLIFSYYNVKTPLLLNRQEYTFNEIHEFSKWAVSEKSKNSELKILLFNPYIFVSLYDLEESDFAYIKRSEVNNTEDLLNLVSLNKISHIVYFHVFSNKSWIPSYLNKYYHLDEFSAGNYSFSLVKQFSDLRNPGVHFARVYGITKK